MRYAGQVNQQAIELAMDAAQPGVRLSLLDELIERFIRSKDCEPAFKGYKDFPNSACISPNDAIVHGIPNDYEIQPSDIITIDVGTRYGGYCIDAARTMIVPPVTDQRHELQFAANVILAAELDVVKAGCTLMDIVNAATDMARRYNVHVFPEWGGHQIGTTIHEPLDGSEDTFIPNVLDTNKGNLSISIQKHRFQYKLKAGQTICLEPVVTFGSGDMIVDEDGWTYRTKDGTDAAHTERCLVVTEKGYELLS